MITFETIWELVILVTFWCNGIFINSDEGDALYFLNRLTRGWGIWGKPVVQCVNCMASLHTVIVMALYFGLFPAHEPFWKYIILWAIVAVICTFLNGLVYLAYKYLEKRI